MLTCATHPGSERRHVRISPDRQGVTRLHATAAQQRSRRRQRAGLRRSSRRLTPAGDDIPRRPQPLPDMPSWSPTTSLSRPHRAEADSTRRWPLAIGAARAVAPPPSFALCRRHPRRRASAASLARQVLAPRSERRPRADAHRGIDSLRPCCRRRCALLRHAPPQKRGGRPVLRGRSDRRHAAHRRPRTPGVSS